MLGDDLTAVDGAAGSWIAAGLGGEAGTVARFVPAVFDAYARIFHRACDDDGRPVSWAEVARRLGRNAHPEMQWHQLVGSSDPFNLSGSKWHGSNPRVGGLEIDELDRLSDLLADDTSDPERCFFGLCGIQGWVEGALSPGESRQRRLELPKDRDHVVFSGPLSAVDQIGDARGAGRGEPSTPIPPDPFWREAPNLIWPADRSWLVVSEVDFDSTLLGGTRGLVDALIRSGDLETYEVEPSTSLVAFSDKLNPVAEREHR